MKKTYSIASSGFLLISFLFILAILLSTAALSLTMTRWLWKASQAEMIYSELLNSQQGALHEVKQLIAVQQVPAGCWHHSAEPWLREALFEKNPRLGCRLTNHTSFYWLERLTVADSVNVPSSYHLTLITQKQEQSVMINFFGAAIVEKPLISF